MKQSRSACLPLLFCLIMMMALLVARGAMADEPAYAAFQSARALASGPAAPAGAPLFVALLAGLGCLGAPIPQAGALLSILGWLLSIVTVYGIGLRFKRPALAVFAAATLALEPTLFQLIGQDTLFMMGWLWGALALAVYKRRLASAFLLTVVAASTLYHVCLALPNPSATLRMNVLRSTFYASLFSGLAWLGGWGVDWAATWMSRLPRHRPDRRALTLSVMAVALIGWGYARGVPARALSGAPHTRERMALWQQAGAWLQEHTPPEAIVWSDAEGVAGYFSDRRVTSVMWPEAPPDYCLALNSLDWQERVSQPWFQEHYRRVYTIANPYDSLAPLAIWRYSPGPFDIGPLLEMDARFGQAQGERIELIHYRLDSTELIPGEAQHLTLTWRATEPVTRALGVSVRLYALDTEQVWAQVDRLAPAGARTVVWPLDRPLTDRYTLPIPQELPPGAFELKVRVYVDKPAHALQELSLARLEAPPWISHEPLRAAHPLTVTFGGEIALTGYSMRPLLADDALVTVERGAHSALRVRLYWRALVAPSASYHVFVHVLTDDNRLVAQHDGIPVNGAYPTYTWQAGQFIVDEHLVPIDANLAPGRYRLQVGLYQIENGERLPVRGLTGQVFPEEVLLARVDVE